MLHGDTIMLYIGQLSRCCSMDFLIGVRLKEIQAQQKPAHLHYVKDVTFIQINNPACWLQGNLCFTDLEAPFLNRLCKNVCI